MPLSVFGVATIFRSVGIDYRLIAGGSLLPLVLLPIALIAMTAIIRREEAYLHTAFGDAYDQYCRRVRRWV